MTFKIWALMLILPGISWYVVIMWLFFYFVSLDIGTCGLCRIVNYSGLIASLWFVGFSHTLSKKRNQTYIEDNWLSSNFEFNLWICKLSVDIQVSSRLCEKNIKMQHGCYLFKEYFKLKIKPMILRLRTTFKYNFFSNENRQ